MEKRRDLTSTAIYCGAAISAIIAFISLFFRYTAAKTGTFSKTGFQLFKAGSAINNTLLVLFIILAAAVVIMAIVQMLGMTENKLYTYIFVILGMALMVVSLILFFTIVRIEWAGLTYEYKRGIGLTLNLIFSILTAVFCAALLYFAFRKA